MGFIVSSCYVLYELVPNLKVAFVIILYKLMKMFSTRGQRFPHWFALHLSLFL